MNTSPDVTRLVSRARLRTVPVADLDAQEAISTLWPRCDTAVLAEIAGRQRMRATFERVAAGR